MLVKLKYNRKTFFNFFKLALFISFIDIVLFSLHRILVKYNFTNPDTYDYIISDFTWINYIIFFFLSFIVFLITFLFLIIVPKNIFQINIKKKTFVILLFFLLISSFYVCFILQDFRPRYTKDSITSFEGIIFMLNNILLLCLYTIYILNREKDNSIYFVILLVCSILTIDGLAKGLFTLAILIFEFYRLSHKKKKYFFLIFILAIPIIIYVSFNFKYSYRSDDYYIFNDNFESILIYIYDFIIPRISVHGEHLNAFIFNKLDISNYSFLANIISESFNNRLKILFNDGHDLFYPKTVGQSITFNVRGAYDRGGSSPGYVLSVISFLPFTLPLIILITSIFKNFFLRLNEKLTFIEIACLCYIFKAITVNLLDMLGLISPNLLLLFLIYLSCNIYLKDSNKKKFIYN